MMHSETTSSGGEEDSITQHTSIITNPSLTVIYSADHKPLSNFLPSGSMSFTSKISSNKIPAISVLVYEPGKENVKLDKDEVSII